MRKILVSLLALAMILALAPAASASGHRGTITEIVAASGGDFDDRKGDYDILLNAVITANLADALNNPDDNLTVFAPNDLAFFRTASDLGYTGGYDEAAVWDFLVGAFTTLGNGDPIPVLTNVLLYHVAGEKLSLFKVLFGGKITTLLGEQINPRFLSLGDKDPDIRNPRLIIRKLQIPAANGFIHGINRVLIPLDLP